MKKPSRYDPCPCSSGKKYKDCCLNKQTHDAIESIPTKNKILKCEAPGRDVPIPEDLKNRPHKEGLCCCLICTPPRKPKWALCPTHPKEWENKVINAIYTDPEYYRL